MFFYDSIDSWFFKERLQTIPGVSDIQIFGEKLYAMRLWFDQAKLAIYKIAPIEVMNALNNENIELPDGRIEGNHIKITARTLSYLETTKEFNSMVIRKEGGRIVRLRDISYAELNPEN